MNSLLEQFVSECRDLIEAASRCLLDLENDSSNKAQIDELFALMKDGKIDPLISETFPLERGGEAIAKLENREAVGKLVVTMD